MKALTVELNNLQNEEWTAKEKENVALITDFIQHLMNDHDFEYIDRHFGHHNYTQHNRNMTDTISGVVESVSGIVKRFPDYTYDVKHIFADGNHVTFHSHVTMNKADRGDDTKGLNIMDTWRIQDGQIVEHWDAIQPLDRSMRFFVFMNGGKIRNDNGVF
ncbi:MAG: nuclear transport factor 2 family protein [Bacteroidota bacterium]